MRGYNTFSAIFVVSLVGSTSMVDAQTGEFAATVPAAARTEHLAQ